MIDTIRTFLGNEQLLAAWLFIMLISLILSLTVGLAAAYPVNVLLVHFGVKEGMGDPRDTSGGGHDHH